MFPVFQNGSCWVKADFHLHTNADKEFNYTPVTKNYYADYVEALKKASIGVGAITNHNKFDADEFKLLRKKAREEGIELLPGIELSVKDGRTGIHTLVIFSDEWFLNKQQTNHIANFLANTFAGVSNYENENARSNHDIERTIKALNHYELDYFIIFAHVEAPNGLWGGLSPGRIKELFDEGYIRNRVLGFQKVRTYTEKTKIKQQLGTLYPAEVEGCDAKNLADISVRPQACYLKVGDYSFEAIRFALRDFHNRVKNIVPEVRHSHIRRVYFEGAGTLGGTTINLSSELNTLIGIRGSGKSSILEGIRYALDIKLGDKASEQDYKESLVDNLLKSGGKITLDVVCRRGVHYKISRIYQKEPEVFINNVLQDAISIKETVLHNPVYFGQKDLSNTGEGFENDLIQKLAGEKLDPVRKEIENQCAVVQDHLRKILRLSNNQAELEVWQAKLTDANFKLSFYQQHNVEQKLEKHTTFERDERHFNEKNSGAEIFLKEVEETITGILDIARNEGKYTSTENQAYVDDYYSLYNKLMLCFENINKSVSSAKNVLEQLKAKASEFTERKKSLNEEFAEIERKLSEELKDAGADKISTTEYKKLVADVEIATQNIDKYKKAEEDKTSQIVELEEELTRLNELWKKEHDQITTMLDAINDSGSPLKITTQFKADKKQMQACIKEKFYGSKLREATFAAVADNYDDFGDLWRNRDKISSIVTNSPEIFLDYLEKNIIDLIIWQPGNIYTIEYRGKPLIQHSLGQRASALMLFVLNQKNNDIIIIDQPEDDLDNQTIYDDVIKLIRTLKPSMQFIFATHNANIPVLGDAEYVHSCEYSAGKIKTSGGSIDSSVVQKHIIAVMEGGKEAFERRRSVYSAWLN